MASLILSDGTKLKGNLGGSLTGADGEVVFNTGMVGYPEAFTDPSYRGQILVLTYPLIGNYGVPAESYDENGILKHFESESVHIRGLIVSELCLKPSHHQYAQTLDSWLKGQKIPILSGIDTRVLTQKLRETGPMLGQIVADGQQTKKKIIDPNTLDLVREVTIKKPIFYKKGPKTVVIIDCGMKLNILRNFLNRNVSVYRVPYDYDFWQDDRKFDGLFISNGPGDPKTNIITIKNVKKAIERKIPTFGICLGNQIMGLAVGGDTYKIPYGHRSQNQPCIETKSRRCYITSQNHGYAVDRKSLPKDWLVFWTNANDNTVEGIRHEKLPFFAVQFHPEACPGPTDTEFLFDDFVKML